MDESNPIILLISIGKRGPSTFIFEPIYKINFDPLSIRKFRELLQISIHEFSIAFDFNPPTIQRLESGKKYDLGTARRVQIYLEFPKVSLWQIELNSGKIHHETYHKLLAYFKNSNKKTKL